MPAALDPVPRHLRIPYRRMPVTHRLPHTVPPCTHGFSRNCMQCDLVPHSFQPSAPSASSLRPQYPRRSQHPAHHASRHLRHPTHRAPIAYSIRATASQALAASRPPYLQVPAPSSPPHPSAYSPRLSAPSSCGIRPTMPPGACSIRPTAPKRLQPSPKHPRLPSHCTPDSPSLPHNASLGFPVWPLLHIMHQAPTRQLPAVPAIRMSSAHSPPRLYTPGARDFPLMCTSVAHDPSRICTLVVHGFSCAAQCAPSAPPHSSQACTSSIRCRTSARQTRRVSRRSPGRPSTRALFTLA